MQKRIFIAVAMLMWVACTDDPVPPPPSSSSAPVVENSYISFQPVWSTDIMQSKAWQEREKTWHDYRKKFPWHFQMAGLQSFPEDESVLLVLSEPPAHITLEALKSFFSFYNSQIEIKQHPVGHDGWVRDALVAVADVPAAEMKKMIERLNTWLYHTDYKSEYFLPLPVAANRTNFLRTSLNYQVTLPELRRWFLEGGELLYKNDNSGIPLNLAALLGTGTTGVFFSQQPGFVVWIIPQNTDLSVRKEEIRHFTLDSDLILGAIANDRFLAIIGRERVNSVHELPPLRTETLLQLAAADKEELAQSYERTMFLAGKLPGGKDWAPIYLSDELLNTEYGSLLNITDQMLKSWSCNGKIDYQSWNYPKPGRYIFKGSVMEEVKSSSITFNWNTKGAAYVANENDFDIVALNRTGSLPVSYIPEGVKDGETSISRVKKVEEKGYTYFSGLNNPDLVRVVQYGALYQIFRNYDIRSTEVPSNGYKPSSNPLVASYTSALRKIADLNQPEIATLARKMVIGLMKKSPDFALFMLLDMDPAEAFEPEITRVRRHLEEMQQTAGYVRSMGNEPLAKMARFLATPRDGGLIYQEDEPFANAAFEFAQHTFPLALYGYERYLGVDIQSVYQSYVSAWAGSQSEWIKTPSVVVSWQRDSALATGGHNLSARVVPFKVDPKLAVGEFRVVEENGVRRVYVSAKNLENMTPRMLRAVEDAKVGNSRFALGEAPNINIAPRLREKVVATALRPARGFNEGHIYTRKTATGFNVGGRQCANHAEFVEALTAEAKKVSGKKIEYHFEGFSQDEVLASVKNQRVKLGFAKGEPLKAEGFFNKITGESWDFAKASTTTFPNEGKVIIEIPSRTGIATKARITVSRLAKNLVAKIEVIVNRVFKRCREKPQLDFKSEFFKELKSEGINPNDIFFREEFQDVIYGLFPDGVTPLPPWIPNHLQKRPCEANT